MNKAELEEIGVGEATVVRLKISQLLDEVSSKISQRRTKL